MIEEYQVSPENFVAELTDKLKNAKRRGFSLRRIHCFEFNGGVGVWASYIAGTALPARINGGRDPQVLKGVLAGDFWDVFSVGNLPFHYLVRR